MPYPESVNTVMTYLTLGFLALGAAAFLSLWGAVFYLAWQSVRFAISGALKPSRFTNKEPPCHT
jgi:hypothetical protein